jgi:hypothetical protein
VHFFQFCKQYFQFQIYGKRGDSQGACLFTAFGELTGGDVVKTEMDFLFFADATTANIPGLKSAAITPVDSSNIFAKPHAQEVVPWGNRITFSSR